MNRRDFLLSTSSLLLAPVAALAKESPRPASTDIIFADFESGTYDGWTLTGNCWTATPPSEATFPGVISGFQGKYYMGSYHPKLGVAATGKAVSKEFTIEKAYINFLIGGGYYPNEACLNLQVDGKVVRTRSGNQSRALTGTTWDVSTLIGKKAHIEVVDTTDSSDRGYIMVDRIVFSDQPCSERLKNLEYARKQVDQNTHPPISELDQLAAEQLMTFGRAMGISESELVPARVGNHGTFIIAMTDRWLYQCDVAGNQTIRPVCGTCYLSNHIDSGNLHNSNDNGRVDQEKVACQLASNLGLERDVKFVRAIQMQEVLFLARCNAYESTRHEGRSLTRLCVGDGVGDGQTYFQNISDQECRTIRVDTNIQTTTSRRVSEQLASGVRSTLEGKSLEDEAATIQFAAFFDPSEYRFRVTAISFGSEDFLSASASGSNYTRDGFDLSNHNFVDVDAYRLSQEYHFWCFLWWNLYGRVGGVRGNWIPRTMKWQKTGIDVILRRLDEYKLVSGEPVEAHSGILSDRLSHSFPFAVSRMLSLEFYRDLERATVATFCTHGGPIANRFQLRRGLDVWFSLGTNDSKLGSGNLRHLLLNSCGAMNCFKEGGYSSLLSEWMPAKYIRGLRSVSGVDGEGEGLDRDGWRYFGHYNKGDSISDAWALSKIDETSKNGPVTVAYGSTQNEALQTLADGRFTTERAEPTWSVASVWRTVKQ